MLSANHPTSSTMQSSASPNAPLTEMTNRPSSDEPDLTDKVAAIDLTSEEHEKEALKKELLEKDAEIKMLRGTIEAMARKIALFEYQNKSSDSLSKLGKESK